MSTTGTIATTLVTTTAQARPGELYREMTAKQGEKVWIYVKNAEASSSFVAGTIVAFPAGAGANEYDEVKICATSADPASVVGVAQHTIAAGSYGWILRRGTGLVLADTGGITADTGIIPGNAVAGRADSSGGVTATSFGWAYAAISATATGSCRIDCRG